MKAWSTGHSREADILLVGSALSGGSSLVILKNFYNETIKMFLQQIH